MQQHVIIRATINDIDLARQAITGIHKRIPLDEDALKTFLSDTACYLIIAEKGGQVLGSLNGYALRLPHRPEPQFLLYEIDVRPTERQVGIGTALVKAFKAEAHTAGAFAVWVLTNESNQAAMALYEGTSFQRSNKDDVMLSIKS